MLMGAAFDVRGNVNSSLRWLFCGVKAEVDALLRVHRVFHAMFLLAFHLNQENCCLDTVKLCKTANISVSKLHKQENGGC